jgi:hypothetical protein
MYVCMYECVCTCVCMHSCMYVCMYVYVLWMTATSAYLHMQICIYIIFICMDACLFSAEWATATSARTAKTHKSTTTTHITCHISKITYHMSHITYLQNGRLQLRRRRRRHAKVLQSYVVPRPGEIGASGVSATDSQSHARSQEARRQVEASPSRCRCATQ